VWITSSLSTVLTPTSIALGNFDGLHRGHQKVIEPVLHDSQDLSSYLAFSKGRIANAPSDVVRGRSDRSPSPENLDHEANQGILEQEQTVSGDAAIARSGGGKNPYSTLVTFDPHPQEFFSGESRTLLTPQVEKVKYLKAMGIEQLVLLPFDRELASLSPPAFVKQILIEQLQVRCISVGEDFRFGNMRAGTAFDLRAIAQPYDVKVHIVPLNTADGLRISSSAIREALSQGNISQANQLLGRPYSLMGQVVQGQQIGRTLGFPTANLQLCPDKFLPRYGVYAVRVTGESPSFQNCPQIGVMNIGCRPTVAKDAGPGVEIHLLNWAGDLYGQTLTVEIEQFLRPEQKFASLDRLKTQIQVDCDRAKSLASAASKL
jgi:riboflavin kinase/FMN adenylyltransferase